MPGNSLLLVSIQTTTAKASVRGIAGHEIKTTRPKLCSNHPKIPFNNLDLFSKIINLHVLLRQSRKIRLNLQPHDPLPQIAVCKNKRDHPTAGPQIQNPITGIHPGESGKQHGINGEPIPPFSLINKQFFIK